MLDIAKNYEKVRGRVSRSRPKNPSKKTKNKISSGKTQYPRTKPSIPRPKDYSDMVTTHYKRLLRSNESYQAYHLTFVYKTASKPTVSLRYALKEFFGSILPKNKLNRRYRDTIIIYAFLDHPHSSGYNTKTKYQLDEVPDGAHHHCILIARQPTYEKINSKLDFKPRRETFLARMPKDVMEAKLPKQKQSIIKSCFIQQLKDPIDVQQASGYAAKSIERHLSFNTDDAYQIFKDMSDIYQEGAEREFQENVASMKRELSNNNPISKPQTRLVIPISTQDA